MPAINPTELKIRTAAIQDTFDRPQDFVREIHDLLSFYANRVHRPGESGAPSPAIDAYHVPSPVLRFLERELKDSLETKPQKGLALIDALWEEPWLETRLLASTFLGHLNPEFSQEVMERVRTWADNCRGDTLLEALLGRGLSSLRSSHRDAFHTFLEEISSSAKQNREKVILYTLMPLIKEESFQDLPAVLKYLKPLFQSEEEGYLPALSEIIRQLARRSEKETLYFLQQQMAAGAQPKVNRVVRSSLKAFSEPSQEILKNATRRT